MKKLTVLIVTMAMAASVSHAALRWFTDQTILNFNGDPVPSASEEFAPFTPLDPTVGAFAQLIRIINGNTPFDLVPSGSGISVGNEVVMETMYSGQYDDLLVTPGAFPVTATPIANNSSFDGFYYVRVFDAAQATEADFNLGVNAPIPAGAQYYYQSSVLTYTHNDLNPVTWDFTDGAGGQTTLAVVPEPGTMALLGVGLIGLAVRRRMNG